MEKKEFPILEFDPVQEAMIEPTFKHVENVPNRLVICFFKEVIAGLLERGEIIPAATYKSEIPDVIIYKYRDCDCGIVQGLLGAPACAGFMDEFIAAGVNKVMFCGGAGVLDRSITFGKLLVVDSAVRDEGLSYHYIEPAREIKANPYVVSLIKKVLDEKGIPYETGKTWTTDAFYRETKAKVALRKSEGCLTVEMEQAAMIAVAEFRKIEYGAILYGGDDLTNEVWDSRKWHSRTDVRQNLQELCKEIVLNL